MLWGDVVSKPACVAGAGDCVLADGIVADDRGALGAIHHDGRGELENNAEFAACGSVVDCGGNSLGGLGGGVLYDPDAFDSGGWFGLCLRSVVVRSDGPGSDGRDPLDQFHGAMEHDRGLFVRCFGESVEAG